MCMALTAYLGNCATIDEASDVEPHVERKIHLAIDARTLAHDTIMVVT